MKTTKRDLNKIITATNHIKSFSKLRVKFIDNFYFEIPQRKPAFWLRPIDTPGGGLGGRACAGWIWEQTNLRSLTTVLSVCLPHSMDGWRGEEEIGIVVVRTPAPFQSLAMI